MKKAFRVAVLLLLSIGPLAGQPKTSPKEKLPLLDFPPGMLNHEISGPAIIAKDSAGYFILPAKATKIQTKERFEMIIGQVAGIYFGIREYQTSNNSLGQIFSFYSGLLTEPVVSKTFIYRITQSGNILDSFHIRNTDHSLRAKNGIFCTIFNPFPKDDFCLLPAFGKPLRYPSQEHKNETSGGCRNCPGNIFCYNCPEGKNDQVSVFIKPFSVLDSLVDEVADQFLLSQLTNGTVAVYQKGDPQNFWLGNLIAQIPAQNGKAASIWLQSKEGILHFQDSKLPEKHEQIFLKELFFASISKSRQYIYSGKKGNYQLETPTLNPAYPRLPDKTMFLFTWPDKLGSKEENRDPGIEFTNLAATPEYKLQEDVKKKFRADLIYKPGLEWNCNENDFSRPALVFESNGSLVALDQSGKLWPLPTVTDTVTFLSRLRFQQGKLVWSDLIGPFRQFLPVLASPELLAERKKIRESNDLLSEDTSTFFLNQWMNLIKVPSKTLPERYRGRESNTILLLVGGALYTPEGKKIPISGSITSVKGYFDDQLILLIKTQSGYELRDAGNQLHLSCENVRNDWETEKPFSCTYNNQYFCLSPVKNKLQPGTGWDYLEGLFDYKVPANQYEIFYRQMVWVVPPFFGKSPEQTYYLARRSKKGSNEMENALLNGYGKVIFKGPFSKDPAINDFSKIRLNGLKDSVIFYYVDAGTANDSCLAVPRKNTWIFKDGIGIFFKIKGEKLRIDFPESFFISHDGKQFFYKKEDKWFAITATDGIKPAKLQLPANHYLVYDFDEPKYFDQRRAGSDWMLGVFEQQKFLLNLRTGKLEYLKPHPTLVGVFGVPDSLRLKMKLEKWLVDDECWKKILKHENIFQSELLFMDDEGIALLQKADPLGNEDYLRFLKACHWMSKNWVERTDSIRPICTLLSHPDLVLAKTQRGYRIFHRSNTKDLYPLEASLKDLYTDQNSKTYAIRRDGGLLELYYFNSEENSDHISLGMFRQIAASVESQTGEVVLLAQRTDGKIQGFTQEGNEMRAFWPDACLIKAFPYLPPIQACSAPVRRYFDHSYIRILDAGGGVPIGFYTQPELYSGRMNYNPEKSQLFNPLGIPLSPSVQKILRRNNLAGYWLWEYSANGKNRTRKILPPPGFQFFDAYDLRVDPLDLDTDQPVKAVKLNDGNLDFLLWVDSLAETKISKRYWMYSVTKNQIYPLKNNSRPVRLFVENRTLFYGDELKNHFVFQNGKPVMLSDVSGGIERIQLEGKKAVASMLPWSGFIDKAGNQKISMACEGGACTSTSIRFKHGMASLCVNKRIRYIDENGINPFNLSFCCASEFFGDVALGYGPRYINNPASGDPNSDIIQADKKTGFGYDYPEDEECAWMRGRNPNKYWISKNGRLRKVEVKDKEGKPVPDLRTCFKLEGNYACGTSGDALVLFDTSGNLKAYLKDHEVDWDSEYTVVSDGMVRIKSSYSIGLKGFMNVRGEVSVPLKFWEASHFSNGLSLVKDDQNEAYYIDKKGNKKFADLEFFHFEGNPFSEGFAQLKLKNGNRIVLDSNGNIHPELNKGSLGKFRNGIAFFQDDSTGKFGYLDSRGKVLIKPQFDYAGDFSEGIASVKGSNGARWFIDMKGKKLSGFPEVLSADKFSGGLCYVTLPPNLPFEIDLNSGALTPLKTGSEPASFEEMRKNNFTLSSKSDSFSIWYHSMENNQLEYKILLH